MISLQSRVEYMDYAAHHGPERPLSQIQYIIAHDTGDPSGGTFRQAARWLNTTPEKKASYNYGIERDGAIVRMLYPKIEAWACGDSAWPNPVRATPANPDRPNNGHSLNPVSMSIAWTNRGDGEPLTDLQIESGLWLFRFWMDTLKLPPSRVLGHYEISPGRKPDPESCMPMPKWRRMLSEVV